MNDSDEKKTRIKPDWSLINEENGLVFVTAKIIL